MRLGLAKKYRTYSASWMKVAYVNFYRSFCPRPDHTFQEIMAWSLSGFPSGPLLVYVPFSIMETAKTAHIMASSAITQNMPSLSGLASVSSKFQEPMAPGSWIQDSTAQQQLELTAQWHIWQLPPEGSVTISFSVLSSLEKMDVPGSGKPTVMK